MSKKEQLIENLKGFKAVYENMQEEKRTIEADPNYTPEGKFNAINGLMEKYAPTVQKYHDTANQIIESGIVALNKAWSEQITARLTDIGYQMGLQNTLEMFKNDLINRPEDAAAIIEVYRRDFPTALELIKKAALQGKEEKTRKYADLIPVDNREHNIKLLRQLSGNVDKYISINAVFAASKAWNSFNQGLTGVSASMDSMTEFCENRLNDDLSLIN